ncbi:MAG: hypothetical protein ACUVRL_06205 [Candidatus Saccharicenans sp.]|uniref:hypothetical protein n=1 Tax=Candidatus Saccharicenans sp. TaxID=2819258 RepID=UPI004049EDD7
MIDCLLPGSLCQLREKIRELAAGTKASSAGSQPVWPEIDLIPELSRLLKSSLGSEAFFRAGDKKNERLIWLIEELAANFPEYGLQLAVKQGLILPVLRLSGLRDKERQELSGRKSSQNDSPDQINHLFLPLPARKMFKLLVRSKEDDLGTSEKHWKTSLPVFSGLAIKKILIPVVAEIKKDSYQPVSYYCLESQSLKLYDCGLVRRHFPLRPARCELVLEASPLWNQPPVLSLKPDQFQSLLAGYYLLLTACFSGWLRAAWQSLARRRLPRGWPEPLEVEICFLATELGRLQLGLYRMSQKKPGSSADFLEQVEKLSLKGLHLASRAWKYLNPAGYMINLQTGEAR